jgi:hypothetical protein
MLESSGRRPKGLRKEENPLSQVTQTHDRLEEKRRLSSEQERRISRDIMTHRRMSDPAKKDWFLTLVGYAVLPVLALWTLLTGLIFVASSVFYFILKGLGRLIGGTRNIVTGESFKTNSK